MRIFLIKRSDPIHPALAWLRRDYEGEYGWGHIDHATIFTEDAMSSFVLEANEMLIEFNEALTD